MSNKEQNNKVSWKNRLDELDSIPGEVAPAKNIAWDKLHDRLREKQGKKRTYWYLAAACMFMVPMLTFFLSYYTNKQTDTIADPTLADVKQKPVIINNAVTIKSISQPVDKTVPVIKQKDKKDIPIPNSTAKNLIIPGKELHHDPAEITTKSDPAVVVVNSIPVKDSISTAVIAKKKLRVIHLNDLSDPNQSAITDAENNNNDFRRFIRHSNKDISAGNPAARNAAEHILIKNLNAQN